MERKWKKVSFSCQTLTEIFWRISLNRFQIIYFTATSILYLHTKLTRLNLFGSNIFSFSFGHDIVQMGKGRSAEGTFLSSRLQKHDVKFP